jgi:2-keto-3-deoxy-L-fuconate dehydrogenase
MGARTLAQHAVRWNNDHHSAAELLDNSTKERENALSIIYRGNIAVSQQLSNKSVLVTSANRYMGPAIADLFEEAGARVIRDHGKLYSDAEIRPLVAEVPDIIVINLSEPPLPAVVDMIEDGQWHTLFDALVHPMMRIVRATAGPMKLRGQGKIIAVTSAAPLRGIPNTSGYCAARGAQNAFIRAAGLELAKYNIQVNAIAQNYVRNDTYYPDNMLEDEAFKAHLKRMVPTKKVAESRETAELALYLASEHCTHMVGQILPLAGGWATTTG